MGTIRFLFGSMCALGSALLRAVRSGNLIDESYSRAANLAYQFRDNRSCAKVTKAAGYLIVPDESCVARIAHRVEGSEFNSFLT